jgi:hypothetical protein
MGFCNILDLEESTNKEKGGGALERLYSTRGRVRPTGILKEGIRAK